MPDCAYCGETFDDESAYLDHLRDAHEGELSRIDRRRVEQATAEGGRSRVVLAVAGVLVVGLLVAAVYVTVFQGGNGVDGIEGEPLPEGGNQALLGDVEEFPSEGREHVPAGTEIDYGTDPPTSGPHYDEWTDPGFYSEPQDAGNLVHALEHGNVVIYYDPDALTPEAEESLRSFATNYDRTFAGVVVVPNTDDDPDSPYVLTAWQAMLRMDGYDAETVRAFLAEYLGRGPENPVR